MALSYLRYRLQNGYVDNWLVAGPQQIPVSPEGMEDERAFKLAVARRHANDPCEITQQPVERGPLSEGTFTVGDYQGAWSYARCTEDHFVDLSDVYPTCCFVRGWAYVELEVPEAQKVTLALTTYGQAEVWLNGAHAHHQDYVPERRSTARIALPLEAGRNPILIRFEAVAIRACRHAIALQVMDMPMEAMERIAVVLPTTIEPVERRNKLERIFEAAYIEQSVYEPQDRILIKWEESAPRWEIPISLQLRTPSGRIYAQTNLDELPEEGKGAPLGRPFMYPEGFYHALLMPAFEEYHLEDMRILRRFSLWALDNNKYSEALYSELPERRVEALKRAARHEDDLYAEMAKMALHWWPRVEPPVIKRAVARVNERQDGSVVDLLGLLGIVLRFAERPEFPADLKRPIEQAILGYRYGQEDPGTDVMDFEADSRQWLFHVCEVLAGQLFPDRTFVQTQKSGLWHRRRGQKQAIAWVKTHAMKGFTVWDSDLALTEIIAGLSHLVDFGEDDALWELAVAMMDKMLFSLAVNSHKGVFGGSLGWTGTGQVLNGALSASSGISRLMWGHGTFNHYTVGTVSLACADDYEFPRLIQAIALDTPEEAWSRDHHAPDPEHPAVDKATYRTPDYMLSSVQDYRPGSEGDQEHIWQATMSPAAVVFVNHPVWADEREAHRPNYWRGNGTLPRVAQWKDVLVAVYALPEDDWLGFTHAYFPLHAFDAFALRDGWAFAQKGNAYLALTAAGGLTLIETGPYARRELRSYGHHNVWLCHMGRAAQDGTFAEFQAAILALEVRFDDLSVRCETLRDETLAFGWQGPLLRNGVLEPLADIHHHQSIYGSADFPAEEMIVMYGEQAMRLRFG